MKNYPANSGWGKHFVQAKWQIDEFKAFGVIEVGGNCKGGSILSSVIDMCDEGIEPKMHHEDNANHFVLDEDGYLKEIKLFDSEGNETSFGVEFFEEFLVGVEILEFKREEG